MPAMKTQYLQIRVDPRFLARLELAAGHQMRSLSDMARYAILAYLAEQYPDTQETTTPARMARAARTVKQAEK